MLSKSGFSKFGKSWHHLDPGKGGASSAMLHKVNHDSIMQVATFLWHNMGSLLLLKGIKNTQSFFRPMSMGTIYCFGTHAFSNTTA
jgi:hypothetical protein